MLRHGRMWFSDMGTPSKADQHLSDKIDSGRGPGNGVRRLFRHLLRGSLRLGVADKTFVRGYIHRQISFLQARNFQWQV